MIKVHPSESFMRGHYGFNLVVLNIFGLFGLNGTILLTEKFESIVIYSCVLFNVCCVV